MLNLKKTALAVLALGSSAAFAGTMGPVCTPGNVTVPCEKVAWDVAARALYIQPSYSGDVTELGGFVNGAGNALTVSSLDSDYEWGFFLQGSYHFNTGNDLTLNWYHFDQGQDARFGTGFITNDLFETGNNIELANPSTTLINVDPEWDAVNLEFGQHVDFGEFKNIRFHGGVQYARIETGMRISEVNAAGDTFNSTTSSEFTGFGPRVGADMSYDLGNGLAVYANGAVAVLAGDHDFTANASNSAGNTWSAVSKTDTILVPELEAKLGLTYTYAMAQGELSVDGGWMWVEYLNAQRFGTTAGSSESDFGVQGPYIGLKWIGSAYM